MAGKNIFRYAKYLLSLAEHKVGDQRKMEHNTVIVCPFSEASDLRSKETVKYYGT